MSISLKEFEIYLKVKEIIESNNYEESDLIPKLISGVGIIPAHVPLIVQSMIWNQLNTIPSQPHLKALEFRNKPSFMHIGIKILA